MADETKDVIDDEVRAYADTALDQMAEDDTYTRQDAVRDIESHGVERHTALYALKEQGLKRSVRAATSDPADYITTIGSRAKAHFSQMIHGDDDDWETYDALHDLYFEGGLAERMEEDGWTIDQGVNAFDALTDHYNETRVPRDMIAALRGSSPSHYWMGDEEQLLESNYAASRKEAAAYLAAMQRLADESGGEDGFELSHLLISKRRREAMKSKQQRRVEERTEELQRLQEDWEYTRSHAAASADAVAGPETAVADIEAAFEDLMAFYETAEARLRAAKRLGDRVDREDPEVAVAYDEGTGYIEAEDTADIDTAIAEIRREKRRVLEELEATEEELRQASSSVTAPAARAADELDQYVSTVRRRITGADADQETRPDSEAEE